MKIEKTAVALLIALVFCSAGAAEGKGSHSSEQVHFSAEDAGVEKPVPMPQGVWDILTTDELVCGKPEGGHICPKEVPLSWFSASAIHLSSSEKVDFVVMGEGPLRGANTIPFWVFRATADGYKLVLRAGAHDLIVKNSRSNGYRDIEMSAITMRVLSIVLFRFDGERYDRYRVKTGGKP